MYDQGKKVKGQGHTVAPSASRSLG